MLATGLLSAFRDSNRRWDSDSIARECGKRHPDCIPSFAVSSSKAEEPSKEIQTLVNFLVKQLEPFANEDKDHQIRMLEAKLLKRISRVLPVVCLLRIRPTCRNLPSAVGLL